MQGDRNIYVSRRSGYGQKRNQELKYIISSEVPVIFLHIDRRLPAAAGVIPLQVSAVRKGCVHRHHCYLCNCRIFCGLHDGKKDGKQKIPVGTGGRTGLFCSHGSCIPGGESWIQRFGHTFFHHAVDLCCGRNAGRNAQLGAFRDTGAFWRQFRPVWTVMQHVLIKHVLFLTKILSLNKKLWYTSLDNGVRLKDGILSREREAVQTVSQVRRQWYETY